MDKDKRLAVYVDMAMRALQDGGDQRTVLLQLARNGFYTGYLDRAITYTQNQINNESN